MPINTFSRVLLRSTAESTISCLLVHLILAKIYHGALFAGSLVKEFWKEKKIHSSLN